MELTLAQWAVIACANGLVAALVLTKIRPELLFAGLALLLAASGLIEPQRLPELASNTAVITLILLLLVSAALEKTGLLARLGQHLFRPSYGQTLMRIGTSTVISSAFLNNTAVVATIAGVINRQVDHLPARLLLPLSYAAILGGTLTLIGTSTHLVVNSVLMEQGRPTLALLDFFPIGIAVAVAGLGLLLVIARYLPDRSVVTEQEQPYFIDAQLLATSPMVGRTVQQNGLRALNGLYLAEIVRAGKLVAPVAPDLVMQAGDKLVFCGEVDQLGELERFEGLELFAGSNGLLSDNLHEVLLSPTSNIVGKTLKQVDFRSRFDAAVVAMRRRGERLSGKLGGIELQGGDILVLAVGKRYVAERRVNRHFYHVGGTQLPRPLMPMQEWLLYAGFGAALIANLSFGVSLFLGLALLLLALVAAGVLNSNDIRQRFPFELWVIITGALALAEAFQSTGLAQVVANSLQAELSDAGVLTAFAGIYLLALVTTELMTNNAAAALVLPLALGLADAFGVSAMPFIMAVAYGASASFISPFSYQTHLMVMNLGNYRKRDYVQIGVPMSLLYSAIVLMLVPKVFPF
ncbi:SLC13 family permease [Ferrimonas lipolytica]|uniref:SLC13 family permease n=1 Tax=Ferrimonas lipolytica TaxID=2724191 RepID=A0A6H1UAT4_9GAMM|nr:SLC13 family permease [Ferrimonas lipolytica]QIZ75739.1 SLC13 family permease [Ferrimonas lipolytica]